MLRSVLCIEDNAAILAMLRLALNDIGRLEVQTCIEGGEALEMIAGNGPDLVLLDWHLPGRSGPDMLSALQKAAAGRALPVVLMSAKSCHSIDQALTHNAVLACLPKPLDPMHLASNLRCLHAQTGAMAAKFMVN